MSGARKILAHKSNGREIRRSIGTVVSKSHLPYALTLIESIIRSNAVSFDFAILVIDGVADSFSLNYQRVTLITPADIAAVGIDRMLNYFTVYELCTNLKPYLLSYLIFEAGYEEAVVFDADIFVVGSLSHLFQRLGEHDFILTPHYIRGEEESTREITYLQLINDGYFNTGMYAAKSSEYSKRILGWLMSVLPKYGFKLRSEGMFVEQKMCTLIPLLFSKAFHELKDGVYNVAYWNFSERNLEVSDGTFMSDGKPVVFFHLSSFNFSTENGITTRSYTRLESLIDFESTLSEVYRSAFTIANTKIRSIGLKSANLQIDIPVEDNNLFTRRVYFYHGKPRLSFHRLRGLAYAFIIRLEGWLALAREKLLQRSSV